MKNNHTPAPWIPPHISESNVDCNCRFILTPFYHGSVADINYSQDNEIENGDNPPLHEAKANGYLIASAPDLLKVLQEGVEKGQVDDEWINKAKKTIKMALGNKEEWDNRFNELE